MTTPEDVERAQREAVRGDVVTVRWVCLRVLGRTEKRLCMTTKQDTHTRDEWCRHRATTRCPACDGVLTQRSDGCELVSEVDGKREP